MKINEIFGGAELAILGVNSVEELANNDYSSNAMWHTEEVLTTEKKDYVLDGAKVVKKFNSNEDTIRISLNGGKEHLSARAFAKLLKENDAMDKDISEIAFSTKQIAEPTEWETFTTEGKNGKTYVAHEVLDFEIK